MPQLEVPVLDVDMGIAAVLSLEWPPGVLSAVLLLCITRACE